MTNIFLFFNGNNAYEMVEKVYRFLIMAISVSIIAGAAWMIWKLSRKFRRKVWRSAKQKFSNLMSKLDDDDDDEDNDDEEEEAAPRKNNSKRNAGTKLRMAKNPKGQASAQSAADPELQQKAQPTNYQLSPVLQEIVDHLGGLPSDNGNISDFRAEAEVAIFDYFHDQIEQAKTQYSPKAYGRIRQRIINEQLKIVDELGEFVNQFTTD